MACPDPVQLFDKGRDVPRGRAEGIHRDEPAAVEPAERARVLRDQDGLEGAVAVTGQVDLDNADVGLHALLARAVVLVGSHAFGFLLALQMGC